ncbi:uncharacterized protein LOC108604828 isoform X2 [Drosophila busckii]|uniref:uncharacterized protein LOC108604828 isoform X2 n=1 Tax=Drosophila busckii TaxID=30019 RepID=UPI00083EFBED|nr:uncharacterized protein LOC108604828 isoform X2 [Drosophila busckii]
MSTLYQQLLLLLLLALLLVSRPVKAQELPDGPVGQSDGATSAVANGATSAAADGVTSATAADATTGATTEAESATTTGAADEVATKAADGAASGAADESTTAAASGAADESTTAAASGAADDATPEAAAAGSVTCAPDEMMSETKGCVNRDAFIKGQLLGTWDNNDLKDVKKGAGISRNGECKENETLTAMGCAPDKKPLRANKWERAHVVASHLYGNRVYKHGEGNPDAVEDSSLPKPKHRKPTSDEKTLMMQRQLAKKNRDGDRVIGHNRPRDYVYLPGRLLKGARKCRPYEVLGRKSRCIRKKGPTGTYKHNEHKFGLQKRHRHEAHKAEQTES